MFFWVNVVDSPRNIAVMQPASRLILAKQSRRMLCRWALVSSLRTNGYPKNGHVVWLLLMVSQHRKILPQRLLVFDTRTLI